VEMLKGDGLEVLTEALTICEDGKCALGMYALNSYLTKLLEIMQLSSVMPAVLGADEAQAVAQLKTLPLPSGRRAAAPAAAANVARPAAPPGGELEIEIELDAVPAQTA